MRQYRFRCWYINLFHQNALLFLEASTHANGFSSYNATNTSSLICINSSAPAPHMGTTISYSPSNYATYVSGTPPPPPEDSEVTLAELTSGITFKSVWTHKTVPIFLAVLMFPLLSVNNVAFFTKFNSVGKN